MRNFQTATSWLITILCFSAQSVLAAGKAQVDVSAKATPDKHVELTFKTSPTDGLAINPEGPWNLKITDAGGLKFDKMEFKRPEWKEQISGFTAMATPAKEKTGIIKYKLVAFICTKDKTQCFREVVENEAKVSW
jgi:hypothetical protein